MLDQVTPLILTYNEAPNIARALAQLRWARDIVIVDSFSDDKTLEIISDFPRVRLFQRRFDSFAGQCNFGLSETGITSTWVLSMDADYILTPELIREMESMKLDGKFVGYSVRFAYCINGRRLRSGVYPPRTVLFERSRSRYRNDGHAQRIVLDGPTQMLNSAILHDDRKPLSRWFDSQRSYAVLEARKILTSDVRSLGTADRIRRWRLVAPLAVLFYCLFVRGGVLDGWPGFYYAFQRMSAELILSLYLLEQDLTFRERKATNSEVWDMTEAELRDPREINDTTQRPLSLEKTRS